MWWYYDQGLRETLAQHENETPLFPSSKHHQQQSIFEWLYSKARFCPQSNMLAVWLTEESPQELWGAGP